MLAGKSEDWSVPEYHSWDIRLIGFVPKRRAAFNVLDDFGGLPAQQVQQGQRPVVWTMGTAEMRREHSEHLARSVHQRSRLHGVQARFQSDFQHRRTGKDGTDADILCDDTPCFPQRCLADAPAGSACDDRSNVFGPRSVSLFIATIHAR